MLDYLKQKINELEKKLIESQEKGLAFAYEVKGREEARKESRREMEEFLAEVKRQQAESEYERSRGLELEKARGRIEALELKIMEFSAPKPEPPVPPKPEIPAEEFDRLKAGLKAELAAEFGKMALAVEESRSGMVEALKRALQSGGVDAADAEARRLAEAAGPYNLGFITACFDNLERSFCAAAETLVRAGAAARQAAGSPAAEAATARRHAAILDAAARDMGAALAVFRGVRQEALEPIKKILGS
jgi:hypothetical protein